MVKYYFGIKRSLYFFQKLGVEEDNQQLTLFYFFFFTKKVGTKCVCVCVCIFLCIPTARWVPRENETGILPFVLPNIFS